MPSPSGNNLTEIILRLADAGVEFVLVGGLAAVAQGAPITTFDVDIVHNALSDEPDMPLDRFHRLLLTRRGPEVHRLFQEFLVEARLSSHMWVWGRRG